MPPQKKFCFSFLKSNPSIWWTLRAIHEAGSKRSLFLPHTTTKMGGGLLYFRCPNIKTDLSGEHATEYHDYWINVRPNVIICSNKIIESCWSYKHLNKKIKKWIHSFTYETKLKKKIPSKQILLNNILSFNSKSDGLIGARPHCRSQKRNRQRQILNAALLHVQGVNIHTTHEPNVSTILWIHRQKEKKEKMNK